MLHPSAKIRLLATLVIASSVSNHAFAQQRDKMDSTALTWDQLDEQVEQLGQGWLSGVLFVVRDGDVILHKGYGLANRDKKIANGTETIFGIGSITKDFTKAAILKLAEQGRLVTSDPISNYVADVPADKQAITVDHLLSHRGGLQDYVDQPGEDGDFTQLSRDAAVKRILAQTLRFVPGEDRAYSNSGYTLLAAIVEFASGRPFQEFVREELLEPAGLKNTGFFGDKHLSAERVAVGYGMKQHGSVNSPADWHVWWALQGGGGMVSSPSDLYQWNAALRDGKVLAPHSLERYWAPAGALLAGGSDFGFTSFMSQGEAAMFALCVNSGDQRQKLQSLAQIFRRWSMPAARRRAWPASTRLGRRSRSPLTTTR